MFIHSCTFEFQLIHAGLLVVQTKEGGMSMPLCVLNYNVNQRALTLHVFRCIKMITLWNLIEVMFNIHPNIREIETQLIEK